MQTIRAAEVREKSGPFLIEDIRLEEPREDEVLGGVCRNCRNGALGYCPDLFGPTVRGIIEGDSVPHNFIPQLVDLYAEGRFPFDRLIRAYPLERIEDAVRASESGEVLKAVLLPAGGGA
jgi:Zn-dependent alcohol dehydrogenase